MLNKRLENATDGGQRVAILRESEAARAREREAARAALARPAPTNFDILTGVVESIRGNEFLVGGNLTAESYRRARARAREAGADIANAGDDPIALSRVLEKRISERQQTASRDIGIADFFSGDATEIYRARDDVANLTALLESLRLPRNLKADESIQRIFKSSNRAAAALEQSQQIAERALQAGIPDAAGLTASLNKLAAEIDKSLTAISDAQRDFAEGKISAETRDEIVSREGGRIRSGRRRRASAERRAQELEFEQIVDRQSLTGSRKGRAESSLQGAGLESGVIARRIRELDARAAAAMRDSQSDNPFTRMRGGRQLEAINKEMAALEAAAMAANKFAEALSRATSEAESNLQSAMQREEEARRASLGPNAPQRATDDAARAKEEMDAARRDNERVQDEADRARVRIERRALDQNDPLAATFKRLREIEEQLLSGDPGVDRESLIRERRKLRNEVDAAVQEDPAVRAARDDSTRNEERRRAEQRGRELAKTPAQRASEEAGQAFRDINAEFDRQRRAGAPNEDGRRAALQRELTARADQVAPLVMGFREERLNAALQGPSRAALNVADVNTTEGSRELNRLLRGDDAAKDVNLVELQKQTDILQGILDAQKDAGGPVVEIAG